MYCIKYYDILGHILYVDLFNDIKTARNSFNLLKRIEVFDYFDYKKIVLYDLLKFKTIEVINNDIYSR